MRICQGYILDTFNVALHFLIDLLAPNWQSSLGEIPLAVTIAQKLMDFVVGCLLGETVMSEVVDDIVRATRILHQVRLEAEVLNHI